MKKVIVLLSIFTISLTATDFSSMSISDLNALRGTVLAGERDAFRAEMQSRLANMSAKDRAEYRKSRINRVNTQNRGAKVVGSKKRVRAKSRFSQTTSPLKQQRLRDKRCSNFGRGANRFRRSKH
jgi:hypothetical protein